MPDDEIPDMNLDDPLTWKESGNDYFRKGQYEDAIKYYAHAIQIKPDFIDAWNNMGFALLKMGRIDEAKECNEKVKKLREEQKSQVTTAPAPAPLIKKESQPISTAAPEKTPPKPNKTNIRTPKDIPLKKRIMIVQEYRRTCNQCGTVWHSLVKRESSFKSYALTEGFAGACSPSNVMSCGMCGGAERSQSRKNIQDEKSEIERLQTCPKCRSKDYKEEIVEYEK